MARSMSTVEGDSLKRLGTTVRLARLRRNLSQEELSERMGISRSALVSLESGKPGVAIGILAKALTVFGYEDRLGEMLAADPRGDDVDLREGRLRAGAKSDVADF